MCFTVFSLSWLPNFCNLCTTTYGLLNAHLFIRVISEVLKLASILFEKELSTICCCKIWRMVLWCVDPAWNSLFPLLSFELLFLTRHSMLYSFGQFGSAVPAVSLPKILAPPASWWGEELWRGSADAVPVLLSTCQNMGVFPTPFWPPKQSTALGGCCGGNELHLIQTQHKFLKIYHFCSHCLHSGFLNVDMQSWE